VAATTGIASCAILILARSGHSVWALAVLFLSLACASYGPRKRLLGETWSFGEYLAWRARMALATAGFWVLLAATPSIISSASNDARRWVTGALLVALLTWHHLYSNVLLRVLDASPLDRRDLESFFTPIFERTTVARPTLWRAGARGGVLANALALPDTARGRVLFFDTLLERLQPREIAAILAHEVAHLEHFHPQRLRAIYFATATAVAAIVCGSAALGVIAPSRAWIASTCAPLVILVGLAIRASRMQAEETRSDRRAVELCGDPEALVSGLIQLHAIHRVPRRVSPEADRHATHPSLARRIRAIRDRAADAPQLVEATVLMSSEPGRLAILDRERFTLLWADPASTESATDPVRAAKRLEVTAYDQLTELRLSTATDGVVTLRARGIDGRRSTMPLQPGEAARAQRALDVVDQLLGTPKAPVHVLPARAVPALALLTSYVLTILSPVLIPALLAVRRPTRPLLVALAAALVTAAFVTGAGTAMDAVRVLVFGLLAAAALWQSHRMTKAPHEVRIPADSATDRTEVLALAVPVVLALTWVVATSQDLFDLHTTARDLPWLTASFAAMAVYLGFADHRRPRRVSAALAAVTASMLLAGSPMFLMRVVADPLATPTPELLEHQAFLTPMSESIVEGQYDELRLAPDGRHFLLSQSAHDDEEWGRRAHMMGGFDGWSRRVEADDAALLGNGNLLLLERRDGRAQLRTEPLRGERKAGWTLMIPEAGALSIAATSDGRWRTIGRLRNGFTRLEGHVGVTHLSTTTWNVDGQPEEFVRLHGTGAGNIGFGVASAWPASRVPFWLSPSTWRETTTLLRVGEDGTRRVATSRLNVSCADAPPDVLSYVCAAFDGRVSHLWRYEIATGELASLGHLRGHLFPGMQDAAGRVSALRGGIPALIDSEAGNITTYRLRDDRSGIVAYDFTDEYLAVSRIDGDRTAVMLYPLRDEPASPGSFASRE
jgi:Zn-dependent protease with chaperone function